MAKQSIPNGPSHTPSQLAALAGRLGVAKILPTISQAKPLPTQERPGIVGDGDCVAFFRDGDALILAINISKENREAAPRGTNKKTGKPSKSKTIARVGSQFGGIDLGEGLRLTLWLGEGAQD